MAASTLRSFKCPANLVILRCIKDAKHLLKVCQFSTCKFLNMKEKEPVKFSTSLAAKVPISETTGLASSPEVKIKKIVIISSLALFLVYFCIIREENDLDEKLTPNSNELELMDLKIKLAYCERANLPTGRIKARIQELLDQNRKPVFPK